MKTLEEIEDLYKQTCESKGLDRYELFSVLDKKLDDFAYMIRYISDKEFVRGVIDGLDYAMLGHNAVGAWVTARGWTKMLHKAEASETKTYQINGHKDGPVTYTIEQIKEVIQRNDAVAVENYRGLIDLYYKLVKLEPPVN